jgi:peroxiredoxin
MVFGVASREPAEDLEAFRDAMGISFPILRDEDGAVAEVYSQLMAFPSAAYPQDWVVGAEGRVVYVNNGFELDAMTSAIENELVAD